MPPNGPRDRVLDRYYHESDNKSVTEVSPYAGGKPAGGRRGGLRVLEAHATLPGYRRQWGISPKTRYQLGECDALAAAIRSTPILPEEQQRLLDSALVLGAHATTAIRGNPLLPGEVSEVVASGRPPPGEHPLATEVRNAAATAYRLMNESASGDPAALDASLLLEVHRGIGDGLEEHFDAIPGQFRSGPATGGQPAPRAAQVPELVDGLLSWLDREFRDTGPGGEFGGAVIRAVVTHVYLLWIHPFGDGNGRVARMIESRVLMSAGAPAIASQILTCFYHETHARYLRHLEIAARDRSPTSFIAYAAEGLRDGLRDTLAEVQRAHLRNVWRGFVFDAFYRQPYRKRSVHLRRRQLMLAFPPGETFGLGQVAALDTHIAILYGRLSERTLRRDLAFLLRTGLLNEADGGFSANTGALRALAKQP